MFGFTSSGCFILGIIFGFILAAAVGVACVFYFNSDFKSKTVTQVEFYWNKVKNNVDNSIDAVKKAPEAEPEISSPQQPQPSRTENKNDRPEINININAAVP